MILSRPNQLSSNAAFANFQRGKFTAIVLLLFLTTFGVKAQKPLTNSRQSSYYTYIYKVTPEEVLKFYKYPDDQPTDKFFHTLVDSFKTNSYWENKLQAGNYMKITAEKNRLKYVLVENHSAFIQLLANKYDQRFVFMDKLGKDIPDAMVRINNKRILYDDKSKTYHVNRSKKKTIIQADYAGVSNFFIVKEQRDDYNDVNDKNWFKSWWASIKKMFKNTDNNNYRNTIKHNHEGFMVFNKPMYKPHDTVKFKAFILDGHSKKPITEKNLLINLGAAYGNEGKTIGSVNSYKDGGYEYSFVLNDSLKMTLDRSYSISLESPQVLNKRKNKRNNNFSADGHQIFIAGRFQYEDYELKSIHFNIRTDKKEHGPGDSPSVYLKATDENDLPVPDGRVTLTLLTSRATYYKTDHAFVPDTLWVHQCPLDPLGETKVVIPDSIFPKADVNYEIRAELLNSANEHRSESLNAAFNFQRYNIITELSGDTLNAGYKEFGKDIKAAAFVSALNANDDTLSKVKVMLPSKTIINPYSKSYSIETDSTDTELELKEQESGISISAERSADSLFVKVNNPRNLHFWYSVFATNKLIDAGEVDQLFYRKAYKKHKIITFLVNYIWGGESKSEQAGIVYRNDMLSINVKQPVSIYPGQRVQTDVVVTDVAGKPVANTDLTAWSLTRKFENYNAPNLPYLGRPYTYRKTKKVFETDEVNVGGTMQLNWAKWSHEMGLDSITYYQFTHTKTIYSKEETGVDTVTQVAPFIIKDGDVLPVHILYIDEKPVYFSQATQLQQYSFRVAPGKHLLRFRTSKQNIRLDSVFVERSKKLILGINADYPPSTPQSETLSTYEAELINKYLITVIDNFDQKMALIKQDDHIFFLNPQPAQNRSVVTGPLSDNYTIFHLQGEKPRQFVAEPGYSYLFEPGLLKQKSISKAYPFNKILSFTPGTDDYTQYALTQPRADSIWQQYLDLRSNSQPLFVNDHIKETQTGKFIIERQTHKKEISLLIKNIIIYRYDDPDYIRIYPGNTKDFSPLAVGDYRLFFLLKGNSYDIKEHISIKPNGTNFYKIFVNPTHLKDSVSIRISNVISNRSDRYEYSDYAIENDALKLKEAFNEKYLNIDSFSGMMSGLVTEKDGRTPLPGVTIKVKGTAFGTVSDARGQFNIKVPAKGKLMFSYIGFLINETEIVPGTVINVSLQENSMALKEVVVIGYGTQRKKDISGSIVSILNGKVAGLSVFEGTPGADGEIRIRGISSEAGQEPLYIVDGVIVKGMKGINVSEIGEINILKSMAAVALYGARASNGVVIITTKKQQNNSIAATATQPSGDQSLRKNFSDYAYWQPKLTTDANGKASFTTTFPDDITNWRTFVIGINSQKQTGFAEKQIKSFKVLSASFLAPLFAVEGDELNALGKITNYGTDNTKVVRTFTYNGKQLKQDSLQIKNSRIDTLTITAAKSDSLTFEYTIKRGNGYFDGERRKIPVIEQGVKETTGIFEALNGDTTVNLKFDRAKGPVTFRAEASVLPVLREEAEHLRNYKYLCNEQLASKLKALLVEKRIRHFLNEPLTVKWEKNILEVIKKLMENRKSQGTWGWWKDTDEELWISLHAVEALVDAQKEGYQVELDKQKLTDYLVYQLESYNGDNKLVCLQLLNKLDAKIDYPKYLAIIEKENAVMKGKTPKPATSYYDQFKLILLKQQAGLPVKLDSLLVMQHRTLFGNIYWGEDSYRFFDNSIQLSILAYKIIKNEGKHAYLLPKIQGYLLEQRKAGEWRNTFESALILETILPEILAEGRQVKAPAITLKGTKTENISTFPYTTTLNGGGLSVSKTGSLPVYITGYQQFWNQKPEKVSKDFTVDTWFEKKGARVAQLKGGEPVLLKAEITAKGDADFVMIEIPIPAGCSYERKEQSWQNNEVHREYFKEKVSIFCRKLKQGKYEFSINLIPRYNGKYNLNPAKAEMMYFPVFYGREGVKKVVIGK